MRVVWTKEALENIARAYEYLSEFNLQAATYLTDALLEAGDGLVNFPHRGRPVRGTKMRELVSVSPYIIRYRIEGEDTVVILRVRHTSRRPTKP